MSLLWSMCSSSRTNFQKSILLNAYRRSSIYDIDKSGSKRPNERLKSAQFISGDKHWSFYSLIQFTVPATAFALGVWQWRRLQWKNNLLKTIETRSKQPVVPFPDDNLSALKDLEYGKVRVTGEFLHDQEFFIQPRPRFDKGKDDPEREIIISQVPSSGAHVITPFRLHPSGLVILVNRGWVSPMRISPDTRRKGQVEGLVTFDAVVRHSEKRPHFLKRNVPEKDLWFYRNIEEMAARHGTEPVLLDADYESSVEGGPIGGQTRVEYRNDHLFYSIFWIGIAAVTFIGCLL